VGGFQVLEHTADVGVAATGATVEEVFEQAMLGLADIMGVRSGGPAEHVQVRLSGSDMPALLVDWLSEFLWLHESRGAALASVRVEDVTDNHVVGRVGLTPLTEVTGIQVKAITYHQLTVAKDETGWRATVFFDV
jgi:SHS2 domain-containing protein